MRERGTESFAVLPGGDVRLRFPQGGGEFCSVGRGDAWDDLTKSSDDGIPVRGGSSGGKQRVCQGIVRGWPLTERGKSIPAAVASGAEFPGEGAIGMKMASLAQKPE